MRSHVEVEVFRGYESQTSFLFSVCYCLAMEVVIDNSFDPFLYVIGLGADLYSLGDLMGSI